MAALLFSPPVWQPMSTAAATQPGAQLYFYQTGTTTDQAVYSDSALTTEHAQPVVAGSDGAFPPIYLDTNAGANYKAVLQDANDQTIETIDPISTTAIGAGVFFNHIAGLVPNLDTDTNHDINITAGVAIDAGNSQFVQLTSEITKQLDAVWAVGDDAGGLFSGTVANSTWYHIFLIRRTDTGVVDAGFDTSVTAANIPSPYTQYRRIGSVLTDGSANILSFFAAETAGGGLAYYWDAPNQDYSQTTPGGTAVNVALQTPSGVRTKADASFLLTDVSPAAANYLAVYPGALTSDQAADNTNFSAAVQVANEISVQRLSVITDTSSQVKRDLTSSDGDVTLVVVTHGFEDFRR